VSSGFDLHDLDATFICDWDYEILLKLIKPTEDEVSALKDSHIPCQLFYTDAQWPVTSCLQRMGIRMQMSGFCTKEWDLKMKLVKINIRTTTTAKFDAGIASLAVLW